MKAPVPRKCITCQHYSPYRCVKEERFLPYWQANLRIYCKNYRLSDDYRRGGKWYNSRPEKKREEDGEGD